MRQRWGMLGIAAVGAPLLLAGLSACSAAPALELGSGGSACADSDLMRSATAGVPITNTGSDPVEIGQAGPAGTSILDIEGSWIVPAGSTAGGDEYPFFIDEVPPTADFIRWADRVDPAGAVVEPGETVYLVVSASLPEGEDSGWIQDFAVTAGGTDYVARAGMGLSPGGESCPWSPPSTPDPVDFPVAIDVCSQASADGRVFGVPIANTTGEPIVLTGLEAGTVDGLDLLGSWIVGPPVEPGGPDSRTTWTAAYPDAALEFPDWETREPVEGAELPPLSVQWLAVAYDRVADAETGTVSGLGVTYGDDGLSTLGGRFGIGPDTDPTSCGEGD